MLTPTKWYAVLLQGHCTVRSRFAEQALLELSSSLQVVSNRKSCLGLLLVGTSFIFHE
jgi:hypothetical protein